MDQHRSPFPSVGIARDRSHDEPVRFAGTRVEVAAVWRETLFTFGDNAPLILFVALLGFAGPVISCILASVVLRLDFYGQVSGPLATWLGIGTLRDGPVNPVSMLIWVQAGLGMLGLAFARGAIAHIALSGEVEAASLATACRAARSRFSGLVIGSLVYGAAVVAGAVGVNAVLHNTDFDMSFVGQRTISIRGHAQVLGLRAIDTFVPSPGSPFAEFMPLLRHTAFEPFTHVISTGVQGLEGYGIDRVNVKI